jgi:hypothetical protein
MPNMVSLVLAPVRWCSLNPKENHQYRQCAPPVLVLL